MGYFDEDPFDEIVREFFGNSGIRKKREQFIRGEDEDRVIDFIEDDKKIYLVFEIPGYSEKDVLVFVEGRNLEIRAQKNNGENMQNYLNQKLKQGILINKKLPVSVNTKKFSHSIKNGVLEIVFEKK